MGFINVAEKTINAKLVYYGVGVGGKTTSLQRVHGILCPRNEVQLVSINTEEDSTLLFDFLPINLGSVCGFKIRIQGFTVPGQPKYRQMRKYVLNGADAVVFVVDSQRSRLQENLESLQSMLENLRAAGADKIPIVVQYNKRDLPDVLSEKELDRHFRFRDGSKLERAFTYIWRYWSIPELVDALRDAGFGRVDAYFEQSAKDGSGNGVFRLDPEGRTSRDCAGLIAYLVASR